MITGALFPFNLFLGYVYLSPILTLFAPPHWLGFLLHHDYHHHHHHQKSKYHSSCVIINIFTNTAYQLQQFAKEAPGVLFFRCFVPALAHLPAEERQALAIPRWSLVNFMIFVIYNCSSILIIYFTIQTTEKYNAAVKLSASRTTSIQKYFKCQQ